MLKQSFDDRVIVDWHLFRLQDEVKQNVDTITVKKNIRPFALD